MGRIRLNVDEKSLTRTIKKVENAVEEDLGDATDDVLDEAIDKGKQRIENEEAIWRAEVLGKRMGTEFDYTELSEAETYVIYNTAMHAGIVDEGAQFSSRPNVSRLIPWVLSNLDDWHPFEDDDDDDSIDLDGGDSGGGGGLDAIASQIGTVTEEQETRGNDVVHGDITGVDTNPYDASVFSTRTNRKQNNPTPLSYDLQDEVDITDTRTITAKHQTAEWKHEALDDDQQAAFLAKLRDEYGDDTIDQLLDNLYQWKKGTYSEEAQWFEKIAKANYDVDADIRFPTDFDAPEPDQETLEAYHEMNVLSANFMRTYFTDNSGNIDAYRGFRGTQSAQLAAEILSNPDKEKWYFEDTVLQNYSLAENVAHEFSEGVEVEVTYNVNDHQMLAPDFVLWDSIDTSNRDAEVNIVGGNRHFSRDKLSFSGEDVDDILTKDVSRFTQGEHDALKLLVDKMYTKEQLVTDPDMADRLQRWADEYDAEIGDDADIFDKVDAVTVNLGGSTGNSPLTWADGTYDTVEEGDIVDTEFGMFEVLKKDGSGLWLGWNNIQYLAQPEDDGQWQFYALGATDYEELESLSELTHLGTTGGEYVRPDDTDPVYGLWREHEDGGEVIHLYHKSDAPPEVDTEFAVGGTLDDYEWLDDHIGMMFFVRTPDGDMQVATLQEGPGDKYVLVAEKTDFAYDWWPEGHDKHSDSEVAIMGIPNESN